MMWNPFDDVFPKAKLDKSFPSTTTKTGEAESEPEDGEMVSDSMIGQEDDTSEDTLDDMEVNYPLLTMEDNEEGKIEADETTLESSVDKLKNGGNDEAGFMAEEATIDDIPTATNTTAIQVPLVAEKPLVASPMAETSVENQDGGTLRSRQRLARNQPSPSVAKGLGRILQGRTRGGRTCRDVLTYGS
nr:probable beta-1,3-galactosyltransferase 14 [Tanacetum cinerariifolium]